jgi:hypothetical protein
MFGNEPPKSSDALDRKPLGIIERVKSGRGEHRCHKKMQFAASFIVMSDAGATPLKPAHHESIADALTKLQAPTHQ